MLDPLNRTVLQRELWPRQCSGSVSLASSESCRLENFALWCGLRTDSTRSLLSWWRHMKLGIRSSQPQQVEYWGWNTSDSRDSLLRRCQEHLWLGQTCWRNRSRTCLLRLSQWSHRSWFDYSRHRLIPLKSCSLACRRGVFWRGTACWGCWCRSCQGLWLIASGNLWQTGIWLVHSRCHQLPPQERLLAQSFRPVTCHK